MIYLAKSYQDLPRLSDVYEKNNKQYIKVQLKSGKEKEVRVYSEKEYNKLYPETNVIKHTKSQKETLGFIDDFIWLVKGDEEELKTSPCRYAVPWGWYLPSNEDVPDGFEVSKLYWNEAKELINNVSV